MYSLTVVSKVVKTADDMCKLLFPLIYSVKSFETSTTLKHLQHSVKWYML